MQLTFTEVGGIFIKRFITWIYSKIFEHIMNFSTMNNELSNSFSNFCNWSWMRIVKVVMVALFSRSWIQVWIGPLYSRMTTAQIHTTAQSKQKPRQRKVECKNEPTSNFPTELSDMILFFVCTASHVFGGLLTISAFQGQSSIGY